MVEKIKDVPQPVAPITSEQAIVAQANVLTALQGVHNHKTIFEGAKFDAIKLEEHIKVYFETLINNLRKLEGKA